MSDLALYWTEYNTWPAAYSRGGSLLGNIQEVREKLEELQKKESDVGVRIEVDYLGVPYGERWKDAPRGEDGHLHIHDGEPLVHTLAECPLREGRYEVGEIHLKMDFDNFPEWPYQIRHEVIRWLDANGWQDLDPTYVEVTHDLVVIAAIDPESITDPEPWIGHHYFDLKVPPPQLLVDHFS